MRQQEAFSGVRVPTWTCLSNHFHVLLAVEEKSGKKVQEELRRLMVGRCSFPLPIEAHLHTQEIGGDREAIKADSQGAQS